MSVKQRLHQNFYAMGTVIYTWPKVTLLSAFIVAILCCLSLPHLRIDTSNESNLDKNHPQVKAYEAFHELYGFEEAVVIMVKSEEVFNLTFLHKLNAFHQRLEREVVHIDNIKSMISTSLIYAEEDDLVVEDLLLSFPENIQALNHFKKRVLGNEIFRDSFLSKQGDYTALYIYQKAFSDTLLNGDRHAFTSMEQHEFVTSIRLIVADFHSDDFDIILSGGPMIGDTLLSRIAFETPLFAGLSNLVIICLLFLLFRRLSAIILPLLVINISLASLFGLMAWFDVALSSFSQILPSFILTVGVCDSVHFLSHFYMRYEKHGDKKLAIEQALSHTGLPMMLTSLTTAVGMLSFAITEIIPIRALGIFAAAGVVIVWFYTIVLLPAILTLIPVSNKPQGVNVLGKSQALLLFLGRFSWANPIKVIAVFLVLLVASLVAVSQLVFEHDPVKWLPVESELPQSILVLNKEFSGALAVEILVDTGKTDGVKSVAVMQTLDVLNQHVVGYSDFGVQLQSSRSIGDTGKQV
ncbi:MAG: MMPL family transporter, partial [Pseudomonadales bacterium]|nr:MMPL family transporter [Pseudomonadales bacterium]